MNVLRVLLENDLDQIITGDAVADAIAVASNMYFEDYDGATEKNDVGFNSSDYNKFRDEILSEIDEDEPQSLRLGVLLKLMTILSHYKNTQFTSYRLLEPRVMELIKSQAKKPEVKAAQSNPQVIPDNAIRVNYADKEYGKVLVIFHVPIEDRSVLKRNANAAVEAYCRQKGIPKEMDNYGNYKYPTFKIFSKSRKSMDNKEWYMKPDLVDDFCRNVFPGVPVVKLGDGSGQSVQTNNSQSGTNTSNGKPPIIIGREIDTSYGKKVVIRLGTDFSTSKKLFDDIKRILGSSYFKWFAYSRDDGGFLMAKTKEAYDKVRPIVEKDLDVTPLDTFFSSVSDPVVDNSEVLLFSDLGENKVGIRYNFDAISNSDKLFLKQSIQYVFYEYAWDNGNKRYLVKGDFKQYVLFLQVLRRFDYNVDKLVDIIKNKLDKGLIVETKADGALSKEEEDKINDDIVNSFTNSKFELYGLQKEGVKFLYSRDSAILGSETGAGKTIQMIYAAEMKMRETHMPTLIITLKAVQSQWVQEIIDVMGEKEAREISTNASSPKKWTVLYYDNFSKGRDLAQNIDILSNFGFGIVIFDELHKIKHVKSKRSQNLAMVSRHIPTRWGASATVSANKPLDVKNQMMIINHPLGKMGVKKFKYEFTGDKDDIDSQIEASENLNKWMNLTGVYMRHSKSDMKKERGEEMPNLNISEDFANIDYDFVERRKRAKIEEYMRRAGTTDSDDIIAISKLLAYRESVAVGKVDSTVEKVVDIVLKNKDKPENNYSASKVIVFTNFIESGELLYKKLKERLPKYNILAYLSSTGKKERNDIKRKAEEPNSKVLIMSMKMGGTGISFPNTFKTMIINDYDWTPEAAEQSEGRIYRINTKQDVDIHYMVAGGVDSELFEKVKRKKEIAAIIQRYREEFYNSKENSELLSKIVDLQKEILKIDDELNNIATNIAGGSVDEGFKSYFKVREIILENF